MNIHIYGPLLTLFVSWAGTGAVRSYALRSKLLDIANDRSMHEQPTPRGGGLAIVVAFYIGLIYLVAKNEVDSHLAAAFAVGGIPIAAIGWFDDRKHVSSVIRLAIHILSCGAALWVAGPETILPPSLSPIWIWPVLAVAMAWCVNLYNFMDGLDGFSASEGVFVGVAGAFLLPALAGPTTLALVVAAGCLGFLVWNWPPAKIFMGDSGSGFLGFCFAMLAVATSRNGGLVVWPVLLSVFICDTTVTLVTRLARREPWTQPHNTHAFQVIAKRTGHLAVTVGLTALNCVVVLPAAFLALHEGWELFVGGALFIAVGIGVVLIRRRHYLLSPSTGQQTS